MKNKFLLFCLFLSVFYFSFIFAQASVMINEIMYNPDDNHSDNYGEWIEIYNLEDYDINLSDWIIKDKNSANTSLNGLLPAHSYAIIADNITFFNNNWGWPCLVIDGSLGLSNSGDEIWLWNGINLVDYVNYEPLGEEGDSLQLCNDELSPNLPTPGAANNCTGQGQQGEESIELDYPSEVNCNEEFSIELEAYNFEDGVYDVKIDILSESDETRIGKVWDPNEEKWRSTNYYINFILNMVNGEGLINLDFKIEDFEGEAILRPKVRNIGIFDDHYLSVECKIQEESKIDIIDAPDEARFGESIEVEIEVYRGNTAKYAVYVYVQDNDGVKVSNKISLHFDEKFETNIEIVALILKCKDEQGTYDIIAEGLDELNREQISLEPCEEEGEEETKNEQTKSESSIEQETTNNYKSVSSNTVLESENFLITKGMPYFLTTISLILVIYLIIKKI